MQGFRDLKVWQRSHELALAVYRLTTKFPSEERFGLTSQLRRAAVSVPANIAEGSKRYGGADYARFLNIAQGSLAETEYFLILARDLGHARGAPYDSLLASADEIARMLHALRTRVEEDRQTISPAPKTPGRARSR